MTVIKYLEVFFVQGDEAVEFIDIIEEQGAYQALEYALDWDFGVETEINAVSNYRIYNELAKCPGEYTYSHGDYVLTYNTRRGYVAFYRLIRIGEHR